MMNGQAFAGVLVSVSQIAATAIYPNANEEEIVQSAFVYFMMALAVVIFTLIVFVAVLRVTPISFMNLQIGGKIMKQIYISLLARLVFIGITSACTRCS